MTDSFPFFVYGLSDPQTGTVFYIGISKDPIRRLPQHRSDRGSSAYQRYQKILSAGLQPQLIIFWQCKENRANHIERRLVNEYPALTNRKHNVKQ